MKTSPEHAKPRSQHVEEAIQMAMESRWDDAVEANRAFIEEFGDEDQAYNRLGKAYTELGKLTDARDAYDHALRLNPHNTVAKKNRQKLEVLIQHADDIRVGGVKIDLNLFVEEMGKTLVVTLEDTQPDVCDRVVPGDVAELKVEPDGIAVETLRGVRLGLLEAKLARRLTKFIQGGNRYQAGVTNCDGGVVKVIVRETRQDPKFAGKPSFPIKVKREAAGFRPYARESLVQRDIEIYSTDDDDEDEPLPASAGIDLEDEDGGLGVDDDESIDLAEEADDGDDADEDDE